MATPSERAGIKGNRNVTLPLGLEYHSLMNSCHDLTEFANEVDAHLSNKLVDGPNGLNCSIEYSEALQAVRNALRESVARIQKLAVFH